jgi:hypothetical protein
MISDFALVSQLYSFMESVPVLWSREELRKLHAESDTHSEERGPPSNFLQFEICVLEDDVKNDKRYLHVLVSVTAPSREKDVRGSSKTPLSTSFLWFEDGEIDMPLAREIYERPQ